MRLFLRAFSAISITACFSTSVFLAKAAETPADSFASLRQQVSADPSAAPSLIAGAFQPAERVTPRVAREVTSVVVQALGPKPGSTQLSKVVYAAVHAAPDRVLDIVRGAVVAAPASQADAICAAAVLAIPDPWKIVLYSKVSHAVPTPGGERDFKGEPDFKGERDFKGGTADPVDPSGDGRAMTIAEAVIQAALDARADLSPAAIYAAVDAVLRNAPGWRITAIYDPRGISGVGSAGTNNYANEPLRRKTPTLAPSPGPSSPPITPRVPTTPPPVSP